MSYETYEEYLNCLEMLNRLDPDYDFEEFGEVSEQFQLLEGFPRDYDPVHDVIVPELPGAIVPLVAISVPD